MFAFTIRAVWASSLACRVRGWLVLRPVAIANNRLPWQRKGRRNIVFTRVCFGLVVNSWKVVVRRLSIGNVWFVFLKPKAPLHVIPQQLGAHFLVCIKHDALMVTALEPPAY